MNYITVQPRRLDPFYLVMYDIKWPKTFWTYSTWQKYKYVLLGRQYLHPQKYTKLGSEYIKAEVTLIYLLELIDLVVFTQIIIYY